MVFFRNFEGIFEIQDQSAVGNAEVRTNLFEKIPSRLGGIGIFLLSVFFGLVGFFLSFPKFLTEQKSIVAKLDALSTKTKKLEAIYQQKLADLKELKKSVLKRAFSGEL